MLLLCSCESVYWKTPIDYGERKEKRKREYTRNLLLDESVVNKIKEDDEMFDASAFKS